MTLRRHLLAERARLPEGPEATARRTALALLACDGADTVACFGSTGDEPDTWPLIDALAARGMRVLLPVLGPRADGGRRQHPDWAWYAGPESLRVGLWGIREPTTPPLGAEVLAEAGFVWSSALAATPAGARLGAGGGWYDRALAWAPPAAPIGVLVRDNEVLESVPLKPWDRPISLIVTETRAIRCPE